jgi:predicted  nucleic acid-binding Zn-ribbon protein
MVEVTNELIYKLMLEIQAEQKTMRAEQKELALKVGTIADAMVSVNKRLDDLTTSTRLIAVAVDDHSHRLDRIEKQLNLTHA